MNVQDLRPVLGESFSLTLVSSFYNLAGEANCFRILASWKLRRGRQEREERRIFFTGKMFSEVEGFS